MLVKKIDELEANGGVKQYNDILNNNTEELMNQFALSDNNKIDNGDTKGENINEEKRNTNILTLNQKQNIEKSEMWKSEMDQINRVHASIRRRLLSEEVEDEVEEIKKGKKIQENNQRVDNLVCKKDEGEGDKNLVVEVEEENVVNTLLKTESHTHYKTGIKIMEMENREMYLENGKDLEKERTDMLNLYKSNFFLSKEEVNRVKEQMGHEKFNSIKVCSSMGVCERERG